MFLMTLLGIIILNAVKNVNTSRLSIVEMLLREMTLKNALMMDELRPEDQNIGNKKRQS